MSFAGVYSPPVVPGETQPFSIDFSAQIASGDSIISASSSLQSSGICSSSTLLIDNATISGNIVTQIVGGASPGGFQAGVNYLLTIKVLTANGYTLINYAQISCVGINWNS